MTSYNVSDQDGEILVKTARKIVTEFITNGSKLELDEDLRSHLSFESGLFVTLDLQDELRGCVGFPTPKKLDEALPEAAIAAATQDPRFTPVTSAELNKITFEVTILTPPVELKVDDPSLLPSRIKVGQDGLMIKQGYHSGLLLPQVPVEYGWNEEKFLDFTCQKAGLPSNCWQDKQTKVFSFQGIIFKEEKPNGKIIREKMCNK
jgi:uncharacterized protein (TIGR00296 family)